jgi:hypothetical protein
MSKETTPFVLDSRRPSVRKRRFGLFSIAHVFCLRSFSQERYFLILTATLATLAQTAYTPPSYFGIVVLLLLVAGIVGWIIAAVLGFARARAFGPSTRWFALAAVCMIIYHLQFLALAIATIQNDPDLALSVGAFFNLFVVLASICAILGFVRLTDPR